MQAHRQKADQSASAHGASIIANRNGDELASYFLGHASRTVVGRIHPVCPDI
jgi:hypothetical protein